jgi:hypothetical protein
LVIFALLKPFIAHLLASSGDRTQEIALLDYRQALSLIEKMATMLKIPGKVFTVG